MTTVSKNTTVVISQKLKKNTVTYRLVSGVEYVSVVLSLVFVSLSCANILRGHSHWGPTFQPSRGVPAAGTPHHPRQSYKQDLRRNGDLTLSEHLPLRVRTHPAACQNTSCQNISRCVSEHLSLRVRTPPAACQNTSRCVSEYLPPPAVRSVR